MENFGTEVITLREKQDTETQSDYINYIKEVFSKFNGKIAEKNSQIAELTKRVADLETQLANKDKVQLGSELTKVQVDLRAVVNDIKDIIDNSHNYGGKDLNKSAAGEILNKLNKLDKKINNNSIEAIESKIDEINGNVNNLVSITNSNKDEIINSITTNAKKEEVNFFERGIEEPQVEDEDIKTPFENTMQFDTQVFENPLENGLEEPKVEESSFVNPFTLGLQENIENEEDSKKDDRVFEMPEDIQNQIIEGANQVMTIEDASKELIDKATSEVEFEKGFEPMPEDIQNQIIQGSSKESEEQVISSKPEEINAINEIVNPSPIQSIISNIKELMPELIKAVRSYINRLKDTSYGFTRTFRSATSANQYPDGLIENFNDNLVVTSSRSR